MIDDFWLQVTLNIFSKFLISQHIHSHTASSGRRGKIFSSSWWAQCEDRNRIARHSVSSCREKKIRIRIRIIHMVPWPSPSREKIQSFVRFSTFCSLIELSSNMYFPIKLYFMYFYHHQLVVRWKLYSVWFFPPLYLPSSCVEMEWMNKLIKN